MVSIWLTVGHMPSSAPISDTAASDAARVLGRKSFLARLERLGLPRIQEIARENGKKGGKAKAVSWKSQAEGNKTST
jgi:hypothetical protein